VNLNDVYGGDWLRAEHLPNDRDVPVTISKVETATFKDSRTKEEKQQMVLHFVGKEKQLGLNITNARVVAGLYGDHEVEKAWVGKVLILYVMQVEAFGAMTDAIRIRDLDPTRVSPQTKKESMPGDQFITPASGPHAPIAESDIPF